MQKPDFFTTVYSRLNQHKVRYLISGAFAVNFHGYTRDTGALDLWINPDTENINRLFPALTSLGYAYPPAAYLHLKHGEGLVFIHEYSVIRLVPQLSIPTSFEEAFQRSIKTSVYEIEVLVISLEDLLNDKMKRASAQDISDVKALIQANSSKKTSTF